MGINDSMILAVEDDSTDRKLLEEAFIESQSSCELEFAGDADEMMERLNEFTNSQQQNPRTPSVILLDLNLPRKNGLEILKDLKANDRLKDIPVFVLSGADSEQNVIQSYSRGATGFIAKPSEFYGLVSFAQRLNRWLLNNRSIQTAGQPQGT